MKVEHSVAWWVEQLAVSSAGAKAVRTAVLLVEMTAGYSVEK